MFGQLPGSEILITLSNLCLAVLGNTDVAKKKILILSESAIHTVTELLLFEIEIKCFRSDFGPIV